MSKMAPNCTFKKLIALLLLVTVCETLESTTFVTEQTSEIEYADGTVLKPNLSGDSFLSHPYFDTVPFEGGYDESANRTLAENGTAKVTMVIPRTAKRVKEIDARQMKPMRTWNSIRKTNNFTNLAEILNFYSTELLVEQWQMVREGLSGRCMMDIEEYIDGLRDGLSWALRMDDSNGRYSTGFFWGNNYWVGSQTQCLNIAPDVQPTTQNPEIQSLGMPVAAKQIQTADYNEKLPNEFRGKRSAHMKIDDISKSNISPSLTVGYKHGKLLHETLPNFTPSFFVLRVHLNSTFEITPSIRTLQVGVCMPSSCSDDEVKGIVESIAANVDSVDVIISAIRSRHEQFNIWDDTTFRVLLSATILVIILVTAGTAYDLHLLRLSKRRKQMDLNCTTYDMTKADLQVEKHISLEIGKSGMYVINNSTTVAEDNLKDPTNSDVPPFTISVWEEIIISFSLRININTVCDRTVGSDTIPTLHGLRAISMAWVILGHTCIIAFKYSDNMEYRKVLEKEFLFQTVTNGAYSVDSFFFISGLLVSFLYFRTNAKGVLDCYSEGLGKFRAGALHFLGLLVYRFARLTAPYLYVLGVVEVVMKWYNANAVMEPPTADHINCPQYWWRNILYINTFYSVDEMCMLWSWYLSDDTQFYLIGVICLIIALSHFKTAAVLVSTFVLSSWGITAYVAFINSHMPNTDDPLALFDKIYDKPWTRIGPYLIGMSIGYLLYKTDCRIRMSKITVMIGWILSCGCLLVLIYGLYNAELNPYTAAAYSALSHSAWALGLAWVVVACTTGYGGWANKILSSTILYPFSRVTYCAYLIHPLSIRFMTMQMDTPLHLGKELMLAVYLGQVVLSYILSFMISLAFEAPVVTMLKIVSPFKKKVY